MKSKRPEALKNLFRVDYVTERKSDTTKSPRESIDRSDKMFQYIMNGQGDDYQKRRNKKTSSAGNAVGGGPPIE